MKHSSASFSRGTILRVSLILGYCCGPVQVLADKQWSLAKVSGQAGVGGQECQDYNGPSVPREAGLYTASRSKPGPGSDEQQPRTTQTARQLQANEAFSKGIWQLQAE